MNHNLRTLNDDQLLESAHDVVKEERRLGVEVLHHLQVIQDRKLYLERGYPSLFEFCIGEFGYSNGAAHRRIQAMRLMKVVPEIEEKVKDGELSITSVAQIQSFLQLERKEDRSYSRTETMALLDSCVGKSSREVERDLAKLNPEIARREVVRVVDDSHMRVTLNMTDALFRKIELLKSLRSHVNAKMSNEELLEWLVELGLDKVDPVRKAERAEARKKRDSLPAPEVTVQQSAAQQSENSCQTGDVLIAEPTAKARTRYVKAVDVHLLAKSRAHGCAFADSRSGKRCGSQHLLQKDHVQLFSRGGSNEANNLRWYCAEHNRYSYNRRSRVESPTTEYLQAM